MFVRIAMDESLVAQNNHDRNQNLKERKHRYANQPDRNLWMERTLAETVG